MFFLFRQNRFLINGTSLLTEYKDQKKKKKTGNLVCKLHNLSFDLKLSFMVLHYVKSISSSHFLIFYVSLVEMLRLVSWNLLTGL